MSDIPAELLKQEPEIQDQEPEPELPSLAVKDMHVLVVQDVSGSMESQRHSVATGINEIFGDLKKRYREPCEHKATTTKEFQRQLTSSPTATTTTPRFTRNPASMK